ncbi:MAG: hypothetical protein P9L94_01580 [Candidatus Hinthialibacter antarcticus]|nr:hypothetical protein [Candidatus Hinthialibacter antarcticus]
MNKETRWDKKTMILVLATAAGGGMVGGSLAEWAIAPRVENAILNSPTTIELSAPARKATPRRNMTRPAGLPVQVVVNE